MAVGRQLTVGWQNRPGELANFCEALAEAGINVVALATAEAGEYGAVRLLVDDVARAREVFQRRGVAHTSIEVLVVQLANEPGALARVARRLADAKIKIDYVVLDEFHYYGDRDRGGARGGDGHGRVQGVGSLRGGSAAFLHGGLTRRTTGEAV